MIPVNPLWASRTRKVDLVFRILLKDFNLLSGKIPLSESALIILVDEIPFVYFGSISLPPHCFKSFKTFSYASMFYYSSLVNKNFMNIHKFSLIKLKYFQKFLDEIDRKNLGNDAVYIIRKK